MKLASKQPTAEVLDLRDYSACQNSAATVWDLYQDPNSNRRSHLHAVVTILVLQGLDIATTKLALNSGNAEGNPLTSHLLHRSEVALWGAKVAIAGLFIVWAVTRRETSTASVAKAWFVAGVYSLVVVLNTVTVLS